MKRAIIWAIVVISAAFAVGAMFPDQASKGTAPEVLAQADTVPPAPRQAQAEAARSMLDCQNFAQSMQKDAAKPSLLKETFRRQFGRPVDPAGVYTYDKYTNVTLSCEGEACTISCAGK